MTGKSLFETDGRRTRIFNIQRNLFGRTIADQASRAELDSKAYFTLIDVDSVLKTIYMTPQFIDDGTVQDNTSWLETVTVV